jgi:branched-chain amino acid transport system permease protein
MGLVYALIAAGLSLIFGLIEIVNFAHGEFRMVAMFTSYWAWALWCGSSMPAAPPSSSSSTTCA